MKKIFYTIIWLLLVFESSLVTNAADGWIFWDSITAERLRKWEVHVWDIPWMIKWVIDFLLWLSWTIAVIFIIVWAYKTLFSSFKWDNSEWKNTIKMAITWFIIASLAWFIISFIIENLQV